MRRVVSFHFVCPEGIDRLATQPVMANPLSKHVRVAVAAVLAGNLLAIMVAAASEPVRFQFREPNIAVYVVDPDPVAARIQVKTDADLLRAWRDQGPTNRIFIGSRVVLRLAPGVELDRVLAGSVLKPARRVTSDLYVLQAPDALTAAVEADRLSRLPDVELSHPVRKRPAKLHWSYAPAPNDPYFPRQWHLENRDPATGTPLGFDMNVRSAWADNSGAGVVLAICDEGVATAHPDLSANMPRQYDHNFVNGNNNGNPMTTSAAHGTAVAGLVAAVGNNGKGVVGVAPQVSLASWVIFDANENLVDEEAMMDAFQYCSNVVSVQSHSWGNASVGQLPFGALENQGIENAVTKGRAGLGVVIVRSAGNDRLDGNNVNDDGYGQDPRAITVGAVRFTGRPTSYTTPGAPVLLAALSGDDNVSTPSGGTTNYPTICTTDRQGTLGYNTDPTTGDYAYGSTGFSGTSASAPQISGLCALILNANPSLTWRDVQQILVFAARQLDPSDPDTRVNGAGLPVNHNVGFGVPDAGQAVRLGRWWHNRPPRTSVTASVRRSVDIPDDGLRVLVSGTSVPTAITSIPAHPSDAPHPDDPTRTVPLVDVGQATAPITADLRGKAALIQRGVNYFAQKIGYAAAAGAEFAVVYNNTGSSERIFMSGADLAFAPIPAVMIDKVSGDALRAYVASASDAAARLWLNSVSLTITITNTLSCEHVKLRVMFDHPRRADVRLTLVSPAGTRSVLHHFNQDNASRLGEWDFYSTHHFFESSAGDWRIEVSDEQPGNTGRVNGAELTIYGVPITDEDQDGLDDAWELERTGTLALGPAADPDRDGYSNLLEWVLDWDPLAPDLPFQIDLSRWNKTLVRLSWPSARGGNYELLSALALGEPMTLLSSQQASFLEMDFYLPITNLFQFLHVRRSP